VAADTLTNAFKGAEDALVEFITTGKTDFKGLVDSILADVTRLAVRQSITAPLANMLGGESGGGLASFFGGGGGGGAGGGIGSLFSGIGSLFGFANGGDFTVGPSTSVGSINGVDNRLVAFRARDGESVSINRPGQSNAGEKPVMVNFNIQTPDAESFNRSQSQILARTQASLQRANRRNN
jgi:phage-related minor tail protein